MGNRDCERIFGVWGDLNKQNLESLNILIYRER